jgi:hypothetical protein
MNRNHLLTILQVLKKVNQQNQLKKKKQIDLLLLKPKNYYLSNIYVATDYRKKE